MSLGNQKSVAVNAAFNALYRIVSVLFPFVTVAWASHVLLSDGIGKVVYAQNIAQYFVLLAPLGILSYGTREIAKCRDSRVAVSKLFTELFVINLLSTVLCSMTYYCLISCVPSFNTDLTLYIITGLPIVLNVINVDWFYQGQEEYVYIAIRSTVIKAVSMMLVIIFVRTSADYLIYAAIYVFGYVGNYVLNMINLLRKGVRLQREGLSFGVHFKPILILLASNVAIELYTLLDTTMLGFFCDESVVGYYSNAMKLIRVAVGTVSAIGAVLLPRLSYYETHGMEQERNNLISRTTEVMIFLCLPMGCGMFLLADDMIPLFFGDSFIPAIPTAQIGSALIFILALSNLYGTQVLLTFGQEKLLLLCTAFGAVMNIALNLILIPVFQNNGAAVASVISEMCVALLSFFFARRYIHAKISGVFLFKTCVATVFMIVSIILLSLVVYDRLFAFLLSFALGALVYIVAGFFLRNDIFLMFVEIARKKLTRNNRES